MPSGRRRCALPAVLALLSFLASASPAADAGAVGGNTTTTSPFEPPTTQQLVHRAALLRDLQATSAEAAEAAQTAPCAFTFDDASASCDAALNDLLALCTSASAVVAPSARETFFTGFGAFNTSALSLGTVSLSTSCASGRVSLEASFSGSWSPTADLTLTGLSISASAAYANFRWAWTGTVSATAATLGGLALGGRAVIYVNDTASEPAAVVLAIAGGGSVSPLAVSGALNYSLNATSGCGAAYGQVALSASSTGLAALSGTGALGYSSCAAPGVDSFQVTGSVAAPASGGESSGFGPLAFLGPSLALAASRGALVASAWTATLSGAGSIGGLSVSASVYVVNATSWRTALAIELPAVAGGESFALSVPAASLTALSGACAIVQGHATAAVALDAVTQARGTGTIYYSSCGGGSWLASMSLASISLGDATLSALTATASRAAAASRWSVALNGTAVLGGTTVVSLFGAGNATSSTPSFAFSASFAQAATDTSPLAIAAMGSAAFDSAANCSSLQASGTLTALLGPSRSVSGAGSVAFSTCGTGAASSNAWSASFSVAGLTLGPATLESAAFTATRANRPFPGTAMPPWRLSFSGAGSVGGAASGLAVVLSGAVESRTDFNASGSLNVAVASGAAGALISLAGTGSFSYTSNAPSCAEASAAITASVSFSASQSAAGAAALAFSCGSGWAATLSAAGDSIGPAALTDLSISISSPLEAPTTSSWTALITGSGTMAAAPDLAVAASLTIGGGAASATATISTAASSTSPLDLTGTLTIATTVGGCTTASGNLSAVLTTGGLSFSVPASVLYSSCGSAPVWSISGAPATTPSAVALGGASDLQLTLQSFSAVRGAGASAWTVNLAASVAVGSVCTVSASIAAANRSYFSVSGTGEFPAAATSNGVTLAGTLAFAYNSGSACGMASATLSSVAVALAGGLNATGTGSASYSSCASSATRWSMTALLADSNLGDVAITGVSLSASTTPAAPFAWAISGSASAMLGASATTVSFATSAGGAFSASAVLSSSSAMFASSLTLTLPAAYKGECVAITGVGTLSLLFGSSPLALSANGTFSPCSGAFSLYAATSSAFVVGSQSLVLNGAFVSYSGGSSGSWSGFASGTGTSGSVSGDATVSFTDTSSSISAGLAYTFAYGVASATVSSATCDAGGSNVGTLSLTVSNLPAGLPNVGPVSGIFWRRCDGTGLWNGTVTVPPFSVDLGPGIVTLASPTLAVDNFNGGGIQLAFSGSVGSLALTLLVNASTGAVTATGALSSPVTMSSLFAALSGGDSISGAGPTDLLSPVLSASISSLALNAVLATRTLSFASTVSAFGATASLGAQLVGSKTSAGAQLNATRSLTYSTSLSLSMTAMSGLPAPIASLGSGFALPQLIFSNDLALTPVSFAVAGETFAFTPSKGVSLAATSWSIQSISLSNVRLAFESGSAGSSSSSISLVGSATATVAGFATTVSFTRSPTGAVAALTLDLSYADATTGISFAGSMAYSNTTGVATGSGSISAASFTLGGRSLSLSSLSTSPSTISFSGSTWALSVPFPSVSIAGITVSGLAFTPTKSATGAWAVSLSGSASLSGVGSGAVSIVYSTPSSYTVQLAVTSSSSVTPFSAAFALSDSGGCASISGTRSSVSGLSCSLTSLSLSRALTAGPWTGALAATATGGLDLGGGSFTGSQSIVVAFTTSGVTSLALNVAVQSGSALSVSGSISLTPRSACAVGGLDYASLSVSALVPSGSQSFAVAATGTLARSCAGTGAWSVSASSSSVFTVDLGSSEVLVSGLTAAYSSTTGLISLSGTVDNALTVSVSGSAATRTFAIGCTLESPMTLNALYGVLTGGGSIGGSPSDLVKPLKNAVVQSLVVAVTATAGSGSGSSSSLTMSFGAVVSQLFGSNSVSIAAQLSKGATGLSGTLAVSMDLQAMASSLPGSLSKLRPLLSTPALQIGFGTPASGSSSTTALVLPAALSSVASLPSLYPTTGVGLSANMDLVSTPMGSFIKAIPSGTLRTMLSQLGSSIYCSVAIASVDSMTVTVSLFSGSNALTLGGGVSISGLSLQQTVSPLSAGVALAGSISVVIGSGSSAQSFVGSVQLEQEVSPSGVVSLEASIALGIAGATWWENPLGMGSNVAIAMPLVVSLGVGVIGGVPSLTELAFAGGARIGSTSAAAALSFNLANVAQTAFAFSVQNFKPATLLTDISGCASCFASAAPVLNQLMSAKTFAISFNPSPTAVAIGPIGNQVFIPAGVTISLFKVRMYGILYIYQGALSITPSGLTSSLTLGPVDMLGLFKMTCNGCATPSKVGPTMSLALTSSPSFVLSGTAQMRASPTNVRLVLDSETFSGGFGFSVDVAPSSFASVSFSCSGQLTKPAKTSISFTAYFSTTAITQLLASSTTFLAASAKSASQAYTSSTGAFNTAQAALSSANSNLAAQQASAAKSIASASATVSSASAAIAKQQAAVDSASSALVAQQNAINRAAATVAAQQSAVNSAYKAVENQQNNVNSIGNQCDDWNNSYNRYKDKCKWYRPQDCAAKAYYAALEGGCRAAYSAAEGVLSAAKNSLSGANLALSVANAALDKAYNALDVGEDALSAANQALAVQYKALTAANKVLSAAQSASAAAIAGAQGAVSAASAATSAAQSTLQQAAALAGRFPGLISGGIGAYAANCISGQSVYVSFTLSKRGPNTATVAVYVTIHGQVNGFSTSDVSLPVDLSVLAGRVQAWVTNWLQSNVVLSPSMKTLFTTLRIQSWRRQLQLAGATGTANTSSDPAQSEYPPVWDESLDAIIAANPDVDSPLPLTYNNVSGVYEVGGDGYNVFALADSPAYTSWFPCTTCNGSATSDEIAALTEQAVIDSSGATSSSGGARRLASGAIATEHSRRLEARRLDIVASAVAAGASNNASGLAAALAAARLLPAPAVSLAGHAQVVAWSRSSNLSALCGYLTARTRSLYLSDLAIKFAYGAGTPGGVGGPPLSSLPPGDASGQAIVYPCVTAYMRHLTDVSLVNVSVQSSMRDFAELVPNAQTLRLESCNVTGTIAVEFLAMVPGLRSVTVTDSGLTGNVQAYVGTAVERLHVTGTGIADARLPIILARMLQLRQSRLEANPGIPYASNAVLASAVGPNRLLVLGAIRNPNVTALCPGASTIGGIGAGGTGAGIGVGGAVAGGDPCSGAAAPALCAQLSCAAAAQVIADALASAIAAAAAAAASASAPPPSSGGEPAAQKSLSFSAPTSAAVVFLPLSASLWGFRLELDAAPGTIPADSFALDSFVAGLAPTPIAAALAARIKTSLNTTAGIEQLRFSSLCPNGLVGPQCAFFCGSSWASFSTQQSLLRPAVGARAVLLDADTGDAIPTDGGAASLRSLQDRCLVPQGCTADGCAAALGAMFAACDGLLSRSASAAPVSGACHSASDAAAASCGVLGANVSSAAAEQPWCAAPVLAVQGAIAALEAAQGGFPGASVTVEVAVPTTLAAATSEALAADASLATAALSDFSAFLGAGTAQLSVTVLRSQTAGVLLRAIFFPNCTQQWAHVQAVVALTLPGALGVSFESTLRVLATKSWVPAGGATSASVRVASAVAGRPSATPTVSATSSVSPTRSGSPSASGSPSRPPLPSTTPTAAASFGAPPSTSPSNVPRLPLVAASASAAPGSVAVPGALLLGNISPASLATPETLGVLASAIKVSLVSSVPAAATSATVSITSIVDVATGVALFGSSAGGSRRRRLAGGGASGSQGIAVNYQVLLPIYAASSAASIAAAVAAPQVSATAPAAQAAFGASVLQNLIAAASASGNTALATAVSGATAAAAQPASGALAPSAPAASTATALSGGAIAGIVVGVLALVALVAAVLMRMGWGWNAPTKAVAAGDTASAGAGAGAVAVVDPLSAGINPLYNGPDDARRSSRSPESLAPTASAKRLT